MSDKIKNAEAFAPWISDPDDPNECYLTPEQSEAAARNVAKAYPELIDHSLDGPIKVRTP